MFGARLEDINEYVYMKVDGYDESFEELVNVRFPIYLNSLHSFMRDNIKMANFAIKGSGVTKIIGELNDKHEKLNFDMDFSGCYVMHDDGKAVYVGISRNVISRLRQHVYGKTHYDASLAYKIASAKVLKNVGSVSPNKKTRSQVMECGYFLEEFEKAKLYIQGLSVAFVKIENPLELYVFEPFCALKLKTGKWNTFKTH